MALSKKAKRRFEDTMARRQEAQEIIAAIEAPGSTNVAASLAVLGAQAPVGIVDVADAGPADVALAADVDARISALQLKIDGIISALKAAGLMLP